MTALARRAALIVMVPLPRPSTTWELSWLADNGFLPKVVMVLPESVCRTPKGVVAPRDPATRLIGSGFRVWQPDEHRLRALSTEWERAVEVARGRRVELPPFAGAGAVFTIGQSSRRVNRIAPLLLSAVEVHGQVTGRLGHPRSCRVLGHAEDAHASGGVLDDEERVEPAQGDGVDVEQVAGHDRVRLRSQELRPCRSTSSTGGIDAGSMEDLPHGGGADLVTETGELAMDAAISPGRVLGGQADGERAQAGWDRGASGLGRRGGPLAGNESAVPAQDRRGGHQQTETSTVRQQPDPGRR
jgi:hypothetical protein